MPNTDQDELLHVHVRYELDMLFGTFEQLQMPQAHAVVANALIESFCIHARALLDFFSNAQGLHAKEFADSGYLPLPLSELGVSGELATKLNTQIAHLTKKRVNASDLKIGAGEHQQLRSAVLAALRHFEGHLQPSYRDRWKSYSPPMTPPASGHHSAPDVFQLSTGTAPTTSVNTIAVNNNILGLPPEPESDSWRRKR